tara:strand:- start:96 stop:686 length:591 start_codon:yes stop_codon:yes gene_type:complete
MSYMTQFETALTERSSNQCELCSGTESLTGFEVSPGDGTAEGCIYVCGTCQPQLKAGSTLDSKHWFCLQQSIWSEVAAVQVTSFRMLHRLKSESWAQDVLDQAYLEDSVMAWAQEGLSVDDDSDHGVKTVDSNGAELLEGDSVTLIKDLDVKGANFTAKRGTMVKNIHLTGNPEHIEGKVNKQSIVLKTCFLKKAN